MTVSATTEADKAHDLAAQISAIDAGRQRPLPACAGRGFGVSGLCGDGLKESSTLGPDQVLQLLLRQSGEIVPRANATLPEAQQFAPVELDTQFQQRKRAGRDAEFQTLKKGRVGLFVHAGLQDD